MGVEEKRLVRLSLFKENPIFSLSLFKLLLFFCHFLTIHALLIKFRKITKNVHCQKIRFACCHLSQDKQKYLVCHIGQKRVAVNVPCQNFKAVRPSILLMYTPHDARV